MAVSFDDVRVSRTQPEAGTYSGGGGGNQEDRLNGSTQVNYEVYLTGGTDEEVRNVGPLEVMAAPKLPKVNLSVYFRNGKIRPYLVCRNKTATRDAGNIRKWFVQTTFNTGNQTNTSEDELGDQDPPPALTDIRPQVSVTLGEVPRVLYDDQDGKSCLTPTANFFQEPFVERVATTIFRIQQYEAFISYATMESRKLKMNSAAWGGKEPFFWLIQEVEAKEVEVQLAGGPTRAALVTYTVESSPSKFGWLEDRALIDTHFLEPGPAPKPKKRFTDDDYKTFTVGRITKDGEPKTTGDLVPDYDQWKIQPAIPFTFLFDPNAGAGASTFGVMGTAP